MQVAEAVVILFQ